MMPTRAFWTAQLGEPFTRGEDDRSTGWYAEIGRMLNSKGKRRMLTDAARVVLLAVFGERCPIASADRPSDALLGAAECAYHGLLAPDLSVTERGMRAATKLAERQE